MTGHTLHLEPGNHITISGGPELSGHQQSIFQLPFSPHGLAHGADDFVCAAIIHSQHFQVTGRNSEVMKRFVEHNLELLYRKNFTDWWTRQKG